MSSVTSTVNVLMALQGSQAFAVGLARISAGFVAISAAAGQVAVVMAGVNRALDIASKATELKAATGQTVADIVVLRRAFDNAGIGSEKLAQNATKLQQVLSGLGGGNLANIWERLGLDPEQLRGQTLIQQLDAIGAALRRISDPTERAGIAAKLFELEQGGRMMQLLLDPSAFQRARHEVGGLADVLDRNAEAFDKQRDRLTLMQARLDELAVHLTEGLIPTIEVFNDLIQGTNPAVLAQAVQGGGGLIGLYLADSMLGRLDERMLNWAERRGVPIGARFGESFSGAFVGKFGPAVRAGLGLALTYVISKTLTDAVAAWEVGMTRRQVGAAKGAASYVDELSGVASTDALNSIRARVVQDLVKTGRELQEAMGPLGFTETGVVNRQTVVGMIDQRIQILKDTLKLINEEGGRIVRENATKDAEELASASAQAKKEIEIIIAEHFERVYRNGNSGERRWALEELLKAREAAKPTVPDTSSPLTVDQDELDEALKAHEEIIRLRERILEIDEEIGGSRRSTLEVLIGEWADELRSLSSSGSLAATAIKGAFDGMAAAIVHGRQTFEDFARSFILQMAEMIVRAQLLRIATSFFPSLFGGAAGPAGAIVGAVAGAAGGKLAVSAAAGAASMGTVGKRGFGGNVFAGHSYMVGEFGRPERFVPSTNGVVIPGGGGGERAIEVHNHFEAGVTPQQLAALLPRIREESKAGVRDAIRRREF